MMNDVCRIFVAGSFAVALAGCDYGIPPEATYPGRIRGEFVGERVFTADYVLVSRFDLGTFVAELSNFRFERRGFDAPAGIITVTGMLASDESGTVTLEGTGEGLLRQNLFQYELSVEIGGEFIGDRAETLTAWFFGGGEFSRSGTYVDWPAIRGNFRADAN